MAFQKFEKINVVPAAKRNVPEVSILKSGVISFNSVAIQTIKKTYSTMESMVFFYDQDAGQIGFQVCGRTDPNAMPVRGNSEERLFVSLVSFLRHYNIDFSSTMRYVLKRNPAGMFYINLKEGQLVQIVRKPKTKSSVVDEVCQGSNCACANKETPEIDGARF